MVKSIKFLIVILGALSACKTIKYPDLGDGLYADIQTNKGDILVKLHNEEVPMTVANFVSLSEGNNPKVSDSLKGKPFYDGIKFHRVINNFMIQSGDPTGTGMGGSGYKFNDEFSVDDNKTLLYRHDGPGILSMANSGPDTNSSQFFITHKATPWLDAYDENNNKKPCGINRVSCHTVFGKVLKGQTVVDSIQKNDFIKKIDIIRVGKEANTFDAPKVFVEELESIIPFEEQMGISKALKTDSGLKILQLQEGQGKKVNPALLTTVHYTLYDTRGSKLASSLDQDKPFSFTINKDALIAGWKEGAARMRVGEKSRLFIPSYLGYGSVGRPPLIQPNTDLIFEIEILKVGS